MSRVKDMKDGLGSPVVIIKNSAGRNIYSTEDGLQHPWAFNAVDLALSLVNFSYEYIDDDDDKCTITFETANPKLPDHPDLQEGMALTVVWGYTGGDKAKREVRITRVKTRYLNDKVVFELMCNDAASVINVMRTKSNQVQKAEVAEINGFVSWYKATFGQSNFKFNVVKDGVKVLDDSVIKNLKDGSYVKGIDIRTIKEVGDEEIPIMDFLKTLKVMDDGRSIKEVIDEGLDHAPGGPWSIDTRDKTVTIHNRTNSFSEPIKNTYSYRTEYSKGDILNITTDIRDKVEKIKASNGSTVSDEGKEATYVDNNTTQPKDFQPQRRLNLAYGESISVYNVNLTEEQSLAIEEAAINEDAALKAISEAYVDNLLEDYKKNGVLTETLTNLPRVEFNRQTTYGDYNRQEISVTKDNKYVINNKLILAKETTGQLEFASAGSYVKKPGGILSYTNPTTTFIHLPLFESILKQKMINFVRGKERLSRIADIELIGDPNLEGRDLIALQGVASVHAGKHYVMKCKHEIGPNGYTTKCHTYQESPLVQRLLAVFKNEKPKTVDKAGNSTTKDEEKSTYLNQVDKDNPNTTIDINQQALLDAAKKQVKQDANDLTREKEELLALKRSYENDKANNLTPPGETFEQYKNRVRNQEELRKLEDKNPTGATGADIRFQKERNSKGIDRKNIDVVNPNNDLAY